MASNIPLVSLITPCYNHGKYLDEAIESIPYDKLPYQLEHIFVNDGSTDEFTNAKLKCLEQRGYTVIHQQNLGLATARNNAIKIAKGKYVLPFDSDNKLHESYLTKAVEIMEKDKSIDVVFGDCLFFGEESRYRKNRSFDIVRMLNSGYIDACAIYRKKIWEDVGGYDPEMPVMGSEDWDFWITAYFKGANFYYLNELCFYYRVRSQSMNKSITQFGFDKNKAYILSKHTPELYEFYAKYFHKIEYFKQNRYKSAISHFLGKVVL